MTHPPAAAAPRAEAWAALLASVGWLAEAREHAERWVLWRGGRDDALAAERMAGCARVEAAEFSPFQARRGNDCAVE